MNLREWVTVEKQVSCAHYTGYPGEVFLITRIGDVWGAKFVEIESFGNHGGTKFLTHDVNLKVLTYEESINTKFGIDGRRWLASAMSSNIMTGAKAKIVIGDVVIGEYGEITMTPNKNVEATDGKPKTSNIPTEKLMEYIMPVREIPYSEMLIEREKAEKLPESKKTPIDLEWEEYEKP